MAAPGVTLIMEFQYRGAPEEWSQQYHIQGSPPADRTAWGTLITALMNVVGGALTDRVQIVRAYAYDDTDNDAVQVYDTGQLSLPVAGIIDTSTADVAPGDAAAWVRWKTGRTSSTGKPIYLRKYFHSVLLAGAADDDQDTVASSYRSALQSVGDDLLSTFTGWPGIADPAGNAPSGPANTSAFVTTRTLKRRRRRTPS